MLPWLNRDGKLILLAKSTRTLSYGFLAVIFGVYLNQLGLDAASIGFAVTLILLLTALLTVIVSLTANRIGRRRTLLSLGLMLVASAVVFLASPNPVAVVIASIVGSVAVGAGETGPFLSIEQAVLPVCCDNRRRNLLFSLYNLAGYSAASLGALLAGLVPSFEAILGEIDAYKPLFVFYLMMGIVNAFAYSRMSSGVETKQVPVEFRPKISGRSRSIIARLSMLFAFDSFGGGFIAQSILAYWFYLRFGASLAELGMIFFGTQIITAISFLAAAKIAAKIGLLNTMVFTHLPSNLLLIAVAFAPTLPLAGLLLLARHSLSQMDVPTRQSYIVAVVDEADRPTAAGMTNVSRTLAQTMSPTFAGYLIQYVAQGLPIVLGGVFKIIYDLLLYLNFRGIRPPEELGQPPSADAS